MRKILPWPHHRGRHRRPRRRHGHGGPAPGLAPVSRAGYERQRATRSPLDDLQRDGPAWQVLLAYLRPHRGVIAAGGVFGLLGGLAGLAEPLAARAVVDALSNDRSLVGPILTLVVLVVTGAVIAAVGAYLLTRTAESVVLAARKRLIGRILRLRVGSVDRAKPGDLMSRVTSDTTLLRVVAGGGLVDAVNGGIILAGSLALMAVLDVVLLAATMTVLLLIAAAVGLVLPRIARANQRVQASVGEMGSVIERALGAFRTVKASGRGETEVARADAAALEAWRHGVERARWEALAGVSTLLSVQVSFLVVLGVGGARVASGSMDVASLIAFLLYLFYLSAPISDLIEGATAWQSGLAALRRMREVESLPGEPPGELSGFDTVAGGPAASVVLERVTFRYREDQPPVLREVSFAVPSPGLTAIVGPSGSGKTTIFGLLERFYEAAEGVVRLNGRDVRQWPLPQLRAVIGFVEQDAPILAGSLRENLRYAAPSATEEQIHAVLGPTGLTGLLALPEGLDTQVGHRGTTLSGGQRQRIAIARALLRRPRLLLLDEATSQLDAANEHALRGVIENLARRTTVIVIAHRLSTVTSADQIIVLEFGRVRTIGAHQELLRTDALYRDLAATQLIDTHN